jgi:type IV secretion system protein VirB10
MSQPDTLNRLDGEPEIPSLTPRGRGASYKPIIAAGALILSLVGVLGFAATRYFGRHEATPAAAIDVASATVTKVKFQEPPVGPAWGPAAAPGSGTGAVPTGVLPVKAIPVVDQVRVPSIEADGTAPATAIPVRATVGGRSTRPAVPVGDESPFGSGAGGGAPALPQSGADPLPAPGLPGDPQATLRRYQSQLGGMLAQLQGLTDKAAGGDRASAATLATALVLPGSGVGGMPQANPALFGSMERSATPTVSAGLLGNRSLTMPKGVLFTCSLKTRVITATSGFVACQVQRNVFSDDGKVVLAERGSHLDGEYRVVQVRPGVTRIPVLWTRLRTPNGVTVDLDSPGTGALGESGIGGYVDNRWPERIGAAMLVSLIDDAVKIVATDASPVSATGTSTVLLPSTTSTSSTLAAKVLEATINIPPLLYQNQGSVVGVYVARDVDFSKVYALEPR